MRVGSGDRNKVKSLKELKGIVDKLRSRGKSVVLANGCFDLFHIGHLRYLKGAKKLGGYLIVAVNDNASVQRLKGPGRPIMNRSERVALLSALECVDYVTVFRGMTVKNVLNTLKPNIHVKGSDYTANNVPEKDMVHRYGGKVAIAGGPKVRSTRELIKQIKKLKL